MCRDTVRQHVLMRQHEPLAMIFFFLQVNISKFSPEEASRMLVGALFVLLLPFVVCDVYMHNPRGSNDRNCERNVNRNNGNRLFNRYFLVDKIYPTIFFLN